MKNVLCKAVMCIHNDSNVAGDVGNCTMSNMFIEVSADNRVECACYVESPKVRDEMYKAEEERQKKVAEYENRLHGGGCKCQS